MERANKQRRKRYIHLLFTGGVILVILKASQENIKTDIKTRSIKCQNVYSPNAPPANCFPLGISRFTFNFKNTGGWLGTLLCKTLSAVGNSNLPLLLFYNDIFVLSHFVGSLCLSLYFIFHRKQLPRLQLPSHPSLLLHHSL